MKGLVPGHSVSVTKAVEPKADPLCAAVHPVLCHCPLAEALSWVEQGFPGPSFPLSLPAPPSPHFSRFPAGNCFHLARLCAGSYSFGNAAPGRPQGCEASSSNRGRATRGEWAGPCRDPRIRIPAKVVTWASHLACLDPAPLLPWYHPMLGWLKVGGASAKPECLPSMVGAPAFVPCSGFLISFTGCEKEITWQEVNRGTPDFCRAWRGRGPRGSTPVRKKRFHLVLGN